MDFSTPPLQVPNSQLAIGLNKLKPIANSQLVDSELDFYSELIDPNYKKWFAKRFQYMQPDEVARCASEAKADGKDARRLFSYLVKKRTSGFVG